MDQQLWRMLEQLASDGQSGSAAGSVGVSTQDSSRPDPASLRTSSYVIYVDLPDTSDKVLLVHGYTGAYDLVSKGVAEYLRSRDVLSPQPLYGNWEVTPTPGDGVAAPAPSAMERLRRRGYLTAMGTEEEEAFFVAAAGRLHHLASRMAPQYILMPTYQCNLRCPYCFQDHMRTKPAFNHLLRTITPEMVDRLFAAMPQIEARHGLSAELDLPRKIMLFGGEPLLEQSLPIVEYIFNKARSFGTVHFSAVTNATQLHAFRHLLGPDKIALLQITLDGPPEEHDRRRIHADGSGSFATIAQNITMALDLGVSIRVRMNIDHNNIQQLPRLAEEIVARGWHLQPRFATYTAAVHVGNDRTDPKSTMNSWQLNRALTRMRQEHPITEIIGHSDDGLMDRARQIFDHQQSPIPHFKSSFCGAHNRMYVFDAFGDIYACWERTGDPKIRIGRLPPEGGVVFDDEVNNEWRGRTVTSNPVCRKCRYAFYCGGGCAVMAVQQTGKFFSNYCDGFGKRLRASVAEAYLDHVAGTEFVRKPEPICDM